MMIFGKKKQEGSMALEYVLISAFAAVVSLAAIAYVGQIVRGKIDQVEDKIGVEFNEDIDILSSSE